MIVISETADQVRVWSDPSVDPSIEEFVRCSGSIVRYEHDLARLERIAESLCQFSRELLYRSSRVTVGQVRAMRDAFQDAVDRFQALRIQPGAVTLSYIAHLQRRVALLDRALGRASETT